MDQKGSYPSPPLFTLLHNKLITRQHDRLIIHQHDKLVLQQHNKREINRVMTLAEKLAQSLEVLRQLQAQGIIAIRSGHLSRTHRERLLKNGFLQEVIKGWYIPSRPDETAGESTAWYTSFWSFCASYLNSRFADDWCLSPEQSLFLHTEDWQVPQQLLIRSPKANNNITALPHDTSLLDIRAPLPPAHNIVIKDQLRLFSLAAALIACSERSFTQNPNELRTALSMIRDSSEVLGLLLEGGHSTVAGRLAGAFRSIGNHVIADEILDTMRSTGYDVREKNPFQHAVSLSFSSREQSPYVNRIRLMWQEMREVIINNFPTVSSQMLDRDAYLKQLSDAYTTDAYHSLSIEGYRVSPELIERVRSGSWNPETNQSDQDHHNALAARGYWQAYQAVIKTIEKILDANEHQDIGQIVQQDHRIWYRELFLPAVTAGVVKATDLAGYRSGAVYIRCSKHVPPRAEAVRDMMPVYFDLLQTEENPAVRAVLGHFFFVYIHPYMDGNGRMARFLMNTMLASGGYSWLVIPIDKRNQYMSALEQASVKQDIKPFTTFLAGLATS